MIRLEQLRLDARLTPEQLGEKAGVHGGTVRRIEAGHGAQVTTLGKLADCFDVKPSELLRQVPEPAEAAFTPPRTLTFLRPDLSRPGDAIRFVRDGELS